MIKEYRQQREEIELKIEKIEREELLTYFVYLVSSYIYTLKKKRIKIKIIINIYKIKSII
jgi:hypothetical protein